MVPNAHTILQTCTTAPGGRFVKAITAELYKVLMILFTDQLGFNSAIRMNCRLYLKNGKILYFSTTNRPKATPVVDLFWPSAPGLVLGGGSAGKGLQDVLDR